MDEKLARIAELCEATRMNAGRDAVGLAVYVLSVVYEFDPELGRKAVWPSRSGSLGDALRTAGVIS
ncbi:hypothetical protein [Gryllotalpicola koreensis]|uniref:Uncharacterized protein n=1 Tax=Gryllotalpicola koreensis TaxID=993086 RepID=A0ABP8ADS1_9MICO